MTAKELADIERRDRHAMKRAEIINATQRKLGAPALSLSQPAQDRHALLLYCQALRGLPVDQAALDAAPLLKNKNAVVLYFDSPKDRDEIVALIHEAKPRMRAVNLR